jgi:hypothetical protein
MSIPPSTTASLPMPRWAYLPGETADAATDHDTRWQAKALVRGVRRLVEFGVAGRV